MEHTKAYKLALKYYPTLWNMDALQALVDAGKLRQDEFDEIVGKNEEPTA